MAAVVSVGVLAGCGERRREVAQQARAQQARAQASSPAFDVFHVGPELEGLAMTEAVREHVATDPEFPELGRRDDVTYLYGECPRETGAAARVEGGCLPPLEVQSTPLCEKHARLYSDRDYRATRIRGAPAAIFDEGRIVEIYTGNTTITVYGRRSELVLRAAAAVKLSAPKNIPSGVRSLYTLAAGAEPAGVRTLPQPDPAVLARTEPCR